MSDRCLGLMAKYWQPGTVKTRLAAKTGPQEAAAIYREFVTTLLTRLANTAEQPIVAFAPPERLPEFQQAIPAPWQLEAQSGNHLGNRMHHFFHQRQQEGCRKTVLLGTDSPNIPLAYIQQAFDQLDNHPVVLGPTEDGGYWLVGSAGIVPPIFSNIPWSTPQVWQATVDALQTAGISHHVLPTWYDVDEAADLQRLIADLQESQQDKKSREAPLEKLLQFLIKREERKEPMALDFQPNLSILEASQKRLWGELTEVPSSFVLCGGTAVALHLGHRFSIDFDFFGSKTFDPDDIYETIPFLDQSKIIQKSANTLTCVVDRSGPVQVSFFGVPKIKWLQTPFTVPENNLQVASLLDMAGMKAAVVQKRAEAKDYIDMDALICQGGINLPLALSAGKLLYGSLFHPQNTLKALSYYEDGNLQTLATEVKDRLAAAVRTVDLNRLPSLDSRQTSPEQAPGVDR